MNEPKRVSRLYEEMRRAWPRLFWSPAKRRRMDAWKLDGMPATATTWWPMTWGAPWWMRFWRWLVGWWTPRRLTSRA